MRYTTLLGSICCIVGLLGCESEGEGESKNDLLPTPNAHSPAHISFESVPTRPMAQAGGRLFVTNTRDNHIDVW